MNCNEKKSSSTKKVEEIKENYETMKFNNNTNNDLSKYSNINSNSSTANKDSKIDNKNISSTSNNLNVNINTKLSVMKDGKESLKANNLNSKNPGNLQINTNISSSQATKQVPFSNKNEGNKPKIFQNIQVNLKSNSPKVSVRKSENKK